MKCDLRNRRNNAELFQAGRRLRFSSLAPFRTGDYTRDYPGYVGATRPGQHEVKIKKDYEREFMNYKRIITKM